MDLVKVGKLLKPFGVDGCIRYDVKDQHLEDLQKAEVLFLSQSDGNIPYFVETFHKSNPPTVQFEDVGSKELAAKLSHSEIYLRATDITISVAAGDQGSALQSIAGFEVFNLGESIGTIEEVVEYPQQLMALVSSADYQVLIPLVDEYIDDLKVDKRVIMCTLPEGLVESQL